jgi:hypothetical protein
MNEQRFKFLLQELIDRNPFSVRAMLRIVAVEFTETVPTLAVTRESPPRMLVNLSFLGRHCRNDLQVKAVILHEFLHVLLRHTEDSRPLTPARHLAFDAVINAIIHRQCGSGYSSMMSEYYGRAHGVKRLLRPMNHDESELHWKQLCGKAPRDPLLDSWSALYSGRLIADDIETLAEQFARSGAENGLSGGEAAGDDIAEIGDLLGNHEELGQPLPAELEGVLDAAMKEMNGSGIWREPRSRGVGANPYEALVAGRNEALEQWRRKTLAVLRRHVEPDRRSRAHRDVPLEYRVPVLSPGDRRAFIRSLWSPFIPDAAWSSAVPRPEGTAQVYLDVSGSMDCEMPLIIALLGRLSRHIRRPFWAFSDEVAPALIERNQLRTVTTGGTSMACVLEHLARTQPAAAIVITDGYIEEVDPELLRQAAATRLHAVITRDGNCLTLERAGIPYTQLDEVPS